MVGARSVTGDRYVTKKQEEKVRIRHMVLDSSWSISVDAYVEIYVYRRID